MASASKLVTPKIVDLFCGELQDIQNETRRRIDALADRIREDVVIPLCRRHKLNFVAGNGTFYFFDPKLDVHHSVKPRAMMSEPDVALQARLPDVAEAFKILDLEVSHGDYLGFYIGDVRNEDL